MAVFRYHAIWIFIALFPCDSRRPQPLDNDIARTENWLYSSDSEDDLREPCARVRPTNRDLVKRFNSILPYFDKDHANAEFLRKFRSSVFSLLESEEQLDREVAYYTAALTPLIFLNSNSNIWCLLERFHRALRLYQSSHPTEKRSALKLLQNFRAVNQNANNIIKGMTVTKPTLTTPTTSEEPEEILEKKDPRYIEEIIKNFG